MGCFLKRQKQSIPRHNETIFLRVSILWIIAKKGEKGPGAFIEKLLPRVGKRRLHKILDPFFLYFVGRALVAKAAGCRLGYILMHALLQLETFAYTFFSLHYVYGPKKKKKFQCLSRPKTESVGSIPNSPSYSVFRQLQYVGVSIKIWARAVSNLHTKSCFPSRIDRKYVKGKKRKRGAWQLLEDQVL